MSAYFDTSFLFSLYIKDKHSLQAYNHAIRLGGPLQIGGLLYFEFCQSVRFSIARKGMSQSTGLKSITNLDRAIANGKVILIECDWKQVHQTANNLSTKYTLQKGYRALDILHVATALALGTKEFLTFDQTQADLAKAERLKVLTIT